MPGKNDRTPEEKKANAEAVARHYAKNAFEVQRNRKIRDIERGVNVRVSTITKYGLEKEAKIKGIPYEEKSKSNDTRNLRSGNKEDNIL